MAEKINQNAANGLVGVNSSRLFLGSCFALISTSVFFAVVSSIMGNLKDVFGLTNTEVGHIAGATIWGFTISIFIFGPLCDAIGMKRLMRFSLICHIIGPLLMIFATKFKGLSFTILSREFDCSFWVLFAGALITSLANGTVEAVCNPLVATIYPNDKTRKFNQFHVWFPGGMVIGGLFAFFISKISPDFWTDISLAAWQVKLALVLVPTLIYGVVFTGQKFPVTERVQAGLSFGHMARETFMRPLFLILFVCMGITASLELGPGRWMGEVMNKVMSFAGDGAGILVLVYGSLIMAVLRFFAGPVVHKLSPTGLLVCSAVLAGSGLVMLSYAEHVIAIFASATIFYVGVCYFWPTMLGVTSERVPKGGALALGLMGGWGMAIVGLVAIPAMGMIVDITGYSKLSFEKTKICISQTIEQSLPLEEKEAELIKQVNQQIKTSGVLPKKDTAKALRMIIKYVPDKDLGKQAKAIIAPADDYGGPMSFRMVSPLAIVLVIVFGIMYACDRARGGYKIEKIA
jgi:fucose permease